MHAVKRQVTSPIKHLPHPEELRHTGASVLVRGAKRPQIEHGVAQLWMARADLSQDRVDGGGGVLHRPKRAGRTRRGSGGLNGSGCWRGHRRRELISPSILRRSDSCSAGFARICPFLASTNPKTGFGSDRKNRGTAGVSPASVVASATVTSLKIPATSSYPSSQWTGGRKIKSIRSIFATVRPGSSDPLSAVSLLR